MPKNNLEKRVKTYEDMMSGKNRRRGGSAPDPRAFHKPGSNKK